MKQELLNPQGITEYLKHVLDLESTLFRLKTIKAEAESKLEFVPPKGREIPKPVKQVGRDEPNNQGVISAKEKSSIIIRNVIFLIIGFALAAFGIKMFSVYSLDFGEKLLRSVSLVISIPLVIGAIWGISQTINATSEGEYTKKKEKYEAALSEAEKKYTEEMAAYEKARDEENARYTKAYEEAKTIYHRACGEVNALSVPINDASKALNQLYDENVIFPKYRNLPAIATMYEYFASGRCYELSGPDGAYNLYEAELRQNLIVNKLDSILSELENLKQNQYVLYEEVKKTASILPQVSSDVTRMLSGIASSTVITAQCAEASAKNTEAMKYLSYIR